MVGVDVIVGDGVQVIVGVGVLPMPGRKSKAIKSKRPLKTAHKIIARVIEAKNRINHAGTLFCRGQNRGLRYLSALGNLPFQP